MVETDIHPFVKGTTFDEVWKNKVSGKIGQTPSYFVSLDDLIKMKIAAGLPRFHFLSALDNLALYG